MLLAQVYDTGADASAIWITIFLMALVTGAVSAKLWGSKGGSSGAGFLLGFFLGIIGLIYTALASPPNAAPAAAVAPAPAGWIPHPDEVVVTTFAVKTKSKQLIRRGEIGRVLDVKGEIANVQFTFGAHEIYVRDLAPQAGGAGHPNRTPSGPPSPSDVDSELRKLGKLRDEGLLTDDEFQLQKQKLLNS